MLHVQQVDYALDRAVVDVFQFQAEGVRRRLQQADQALAFLADAVEVGRAVIGEDQEDEGGGTVTAFCIVTLRFQY